MQCVMKCLLWYGFMTINDKQMMAKALLTETPEISLLKISILDFPFAKLRTLRVAMANVEVLIPPPVDWGEAPIHIRKNTIINVG